MAFASFEFFLRAFIPSLDKDGPSSIAALRPMLTVPQWVWLCLGYTLFLFSSLYWLGIYCDTPDMLTVATVYVACGLILRIRANPQGWFNFIALGAVLAVGYFSKAVMFPLAFIFLAVNIFAFLPLSLRTIKAFSLRILLAFAVFLLIIAPYVTALSLKKGTVTFSETGKLSYVWFVYPTFFVIPDHGWQGEPPEFGTPKNPVRQIFDDPKVLEFGQPIGGTYPLWTDPSYWYEGILVKFNLKSILRLLILNLVSYYEIFLGILLFGYLALLLWSQNTRQAVINLMGKAPLLIPAIAGLGVYAISTDFKANSMDYQPATRFIAAFIVITFAGVFSSVPLPKRRATRRLVTSLTLATLVAVGLQMGAVAAKEASEILFETQENLHYVVATGLQELGMKEGDRVAILGSELDHVFWARLGRVKIMAQLDEDEQFWVSDRTTRQQVLDAIAAQGSNFAVYRGSLASTHNSGWQQVGDTDYYVYAFGNA